MASIAKQIQRELTEEEQDEFDELCIVSANLFREKQRQGQIQGQHLHCLHPTSSTDTGKQEAHTESTYKQLCSELGQGEILIDVTSLLPIQQ